MIEEKIKKIIQESLKKLGAENPTISLEHPDEISNGDYSSSVALAYSKQLKMKPKDLAEEIVRYFAQNKPEGVEGVEVAGPGFINFHLSREFFTKQVVEVVLLGDNFGKNETLKGKKVMVEYTDPNPFKEFHIGHLMSNAVGEAISRLVEFSGAEVKRACYQGDVGLHVAKAIWGMQRVGVCDSQFSIHDLGMAYADGAEAYEKNEIAKKEIEELNKKIFEREEYGKDILDFYNKGIKVSLDYFETIYKKLGTFHNNKEGKAFDYYFFEGNTGKFGKKIVLDNVGRYFDKSNGAIIFSGEKYGLHTRVFVNSYDLPTYEAKELGLAKIKYDVYKYDHSIVITGNEVNDYFKVLLCAMNLVFPELAKVTKHLSHGMLRLPTGKMSSRTGNVITGESLIDAVEAMVHKKLEERELETIEKNKIAEVVAIGAIKYSILRQAIGGDIIYDFEKSISFEGDSGPYLQYSYVRAKSVLEKAEKEGIKIAPPVAGGAPSEISLLERLLPRFPEIVLRSSTEYAPHFVATYLIELAGAFNNYYANNQIVNVSDPTSSYKVSLTSAFATTMKNGLWILGIRSPEKM